MPPTPSLLAVIPPSKEVIHVPIESSMTTSDLRDALFSLTDIVPEKIHITLASQITIPPTAPAKLLSAIPLTAGDSITISSKPPAVTMEMLSSALDSILGNSRSGRSAAGSASSVPVSRRDMGTEAGRDYLRRIRGYYSAVAEYDEESLQGKARDVMPLDEMRLQANRAVANATADGNSGLSICPDAALLGELLKWFKGSFFTWVDALSCWSCGGKCEVMGHVVPNGEELRWRANVVEMHGCKKCGAQLRFGRFNHAEKLLETRRGRCGEWAQAFGLVCRAAGLVMRTVYDATDHVWTEIWSHGESRWVHADSCEGVMDERLLYERGWGKKLTYCVAVGAGSVADVTRRYIEKFEEVLGRRTIVGEDWLRLGIERIDRDVAKSFTGTDLRILQERREKERAELNTMGGRAGEDTELPGRQSGAKEWVEARGEDGDK